VPCRSRTYPRKLTCLSRSVRSSVAVAPLEGGLLLRRGFLLIPRPPLVIRHAVDRFARLILAHGLAGCAGCLLVPVGEAVAAEAREVHEVDVLHVGSLAQMRDQLAECSGFELGSGLLVD